MRQKGKIVLTFILSTILMCGVLTGCEHKHSYSEVVTPKTCTTDGYTTYTCKGCGDTYVGNIVPKGHEYKCDTVEATCTSEGYTQYTCSLCGDTYISDSTEKLGHSYENGYCVRCGAKDTNTHGTIYDVSEYIITEGEPNSTLERAKNITVNGTTITGSIYRSTDLDIFKITLGPGETVVACIAFQYLSEAEGSLFGLANSSIDEAYVVGTINAENKTQILHYTNTSDKNLVAYLAVLFSRDYIYINTIATYALYVCFI